MDVSNPFINGSLTVGRWLLVEDRIVGANGGFIYTSKSIVFLTT